MSKNGNDNSNKVIAWPVLVANPTPRASTARLRLSTVGECTREMARVYKLARNKQLDTQSATRLCYILSQLAAMIRDGSLEGRVEALEEASRR